MTPVHVWLTDTGVFGDAALPGIVLDQKQADDGSWLVYVVAVEPGIGAHDAGPYVRQMWVAASAVRPVDAEPPAS